MRVFVYRNLHRPGVQYSFRAVEGEHRGKVIGYASSFILADVQLKVSEVGRQRVLREQKKNVHAGLVGTVVWVGDYSPRIMQKQLGDITKLFSAEGGVNIGYNPYLHKQFYVEKSLELITHATTVSVTGKSLLAINPT